jgi:hypothetical protein
MFHAVIIASFPPPTLVPEDGGGRVIAHDLSREAAESIERDLRSSATFEEGGFRMLVFLAGYEEPHGAYDTSECPNCRDVLLAYHRKMVSVHEKEAARRGGKIIDENLGEDNK